MDSFWALIHEAGSWLWGQGSCGQVLTERQKEAEIIVQRYQSRVYMRLLCVFVCLLLVQSQ